MRRNKIQIVDEASATELMVNPIDAHIGGRVRLRRTSLGITQQELGKLIGVTFQQIQKYEKGVNRISACALHNISVALDVPVSFFFDEMPDEIAFKVTTESEQKAVPFGETVLTSAEAVELVRGYFALPSAPVRKAILSLIRQMLNKQ